MFKLKNLCSLLTVWYVINFYTKYTGSFFYLTTAISHFLLLLHTVYQHSAKWVMLIQQTSKQEVATKSYQTNADRTYVNPPPSSTK
jgi:hypothetical protein